MNDNAEQSIPSRGSHAQAFTKVIDAEIRALMHGAISLRFYAAERSRGNQELTDTAEVFDLLAMANALDEMRAERETLRIYWND
jgi:hypothetical protein